MGGASPSESFKEIPHSSFKIKVNRLAASINVNDNLLFLA